MFAMLWLKLVAVWKNPLGKKIIIGVLICLVLIYGLMRYSTMVYSEGYKQGNVAGWNAAEEAHKTEWEKQQKQLDLDKAQIEQARLDTAARIAQDSKLRLTIGQDLKTGLASLSARLQAQREADHEKVADIPGDQLDDTIRFLTIRLTAGQAIK